MAVLGLSLFVSHAFAETSLSFFGGSILLTAEVGESCALILSGALFFGEALCCVSNATDARATISRRYLKAFFDMAHVSSL